MTARNIRRQKTVGGVASLYATDTILNTISEVEIKNFQKDPYLSRKKNRLSRPLNNIEH